MNKTNDYKAPFTSHLEELRRRLISCLIAIIIGFIISYIFKEELFNILVSPLLSIMQEEKTLIYTNLPEAFFSFLKVSLLSGFMFAFPVIIYQFWMFIVPGLYDNEKKLIIPIVLISSIFFIGGSIFGYFFVFPLGFEFFLGFASNTIKPLPTMKEYLSFSSKLLFTFGIVFELPLVLTILAKLGIISAESLKKYRKYSILIFFTGAAILTPPDVITQIMLALPLIILYEVSIISAQIFGTKKNKSQKNTIRNK